MNQQSQYKDSDKLYTTVYILFGYILVNTMGSTIQYCGTLCIKLSA